MQALQDTVALLPLIVVIVTAVGVLLMDVFADYEDDDGSVDRGWLAWTTVAGLGVASCIVCWQWDATVQARELFGGMVILDRFALFFDGLILLGTLLATLLSPAYLHVRGLARGEYYALLGLSAAGLMVMAHSGDLIVLFIGLETMSVAVYALASYSRGDPRSAEAGLKYFLLGSFASAILLYGIALTWGATGETRLTAISAALDRAPDLMTDGIVFAGMLLLLVGFAFKVALVPFHMWTPDVYEGAPTPVTCFMASAVKAGGFAIFLRAIYTAFFHRTLALSPGVDMAPVGWFQILVWLSILSMTVGNVLALVQSNVKRMLAYSSVAHAGYAAIAFAALVPLQHGEAAVPGAAGSVLYYLLAYTVATVGAFGVVSVVQKDGVDLTEVRDFHGLARRHPALALAFTVFLLSLGGLPPTAGFIAKLQVFRDALAAGDALVAPAEVAALASGHEILYWLVVVGALNSVMAVVYYLRPVVAMYMRRPRDHWDVLSTPAITLALAVCVVLTLWWGILPTDAIALARDAVVGLAR